MSTHLQELITSIYGKDEERFNFNLTAFRYEKREFAKALGSKFPDGVCEMVYTLAYGNEFADINALCHSRASNDPHSFRPLISFFFLSSAFDVNSWSIVGDVSKKMFENLLTVPGLDVNAVDMVGWTPLISSLSRGLLAIHHFECLLQHPDIDVNLADKGDWTCLIHAADDGNIRAIQLLFKYKEADLDFCATCEEGLNALEHFLQYHDSPQVLVLLLPKYSNEVLIAVHKFAKAWGRKTKTLKMIDEHIRLQTS